MLGLVLGLLLQDSAPASRPAGDTAVAEILEKAARAQFPGGGEVEVRDFSILFDFIVRDAERDNEVRARHSFRSPDRIVTTLDDELAGVKVTTGFDGKRFWLRDEKGTTFLEGRENRTTREEISERIRLSQDLCAVFSVRKLAARLEGTRRLPDDERAGRTLAVLEGTTDAFGPIRASEVERVVLRLLFDRESGDIVEALARPILPGSRPASGPAQEPERFTFENPTESNGFRLPREVKVFFGDSARATYEIRRIRELKVNAGLKDSAFAPPK